MSTSSTSFRLLALGFSVVLLATTWLPAIADGLDSQSRAGLEEETGQNIAPGMGPTGLDPHVEPSLAGGVVVVCQLIGSGEHPADLRDYRVLLPERSRVFNPAR